MNATHRLVRLARRPAGLPTPDDFTLEQAPIPRPGVGQVLVRNAHFLVFPGLRTLIGGETRDVPLPPLHPGDTLFGPAIGEVVDGPLEKGQLVLHLQGWRDYATPATAECRQLDGTLPDPVAHLAQGSAAYGALTRLAEVQEGDTVFVTGAAGAVGTMAGQIARLLGAAQVVGSTGSPDKAQRLERELGYDATVLRGAASVDRQLAEVAPDGIDVVLDTVGGEQLTAAVHTANRGARLTLVGALDGQLSPDRAGGSAPTVLDTYRLLTRGITIAGYSGVDHPDVEAEWEARFGDWLRAGDIHFPYTPVRGMERAPGALPQLIAGRSFGAAIVEL
ncbi:MDR family NADP-dependent oxidoreductase [Streptomyces botrytidirepellens]|uniref:NADP-dependent oxidoreductase n=1 Tax=Streptomyces botrytidirepellens TaxID=2486417 RepID=A0A3M8STT6_9ACTN|nr:NADP-dependent oxidoreductase [Streptomyces botrytidirepellens]RNF84731.1 NADP-dependent oxidoreductase [Streptomyces botrytidirepellens]